MDLCMVGSLGLAFNRGQLVYLAQSQSGQWGPASPGDTMEGLQGLSGPLAQALSAEAQQQAKLPVRPSAI